MGDLSLEQFHRDEAAPLLILALCVNVPNARQKYVRSQIKSHTMRKLQLSDLPDDGAKLKTWFLGTYG